MNTGPLNGFKILDLSTEVSGPLCTQILGDYGADVIKVETLHGDSQRKNGFILEDNMSSLFISVNRNKKSISINLKTDEGQEILEKLILESDIIVHNMRLGAADKLGLGYNRIKGINNSIIYCVITGYNQKGPNKDLPAFDDVIQAGCGLAYLNSDNGVPQFLPTIIADKIAGMTMCNSLLAALLYRQKTGIGQFIEVPMFETLASFALLEHLGKSTISSIDNETGYKRILKNGRKIWKTSDGYISMLPFKPDHWNYIFKEFGKEKEGIELGVSDRLTRNKNIEIVYQMFSDFVLQKTTDSWENLCIKLDIPYSRVNSLDDLLSNKQLNSVGFFKIIDNIRYISPSANFSETPPEIRKQTPNLGEDTVSVLSNLGYSVDEINLLKKKEIIKF